MLELFKHAGYVAWPLGLFSIVALAILLERLVVLTRLKQLEERAYMLLHLVLEKEDHSMLRDPQIAVAPVTQVMSSLTPLRGASAEAIQNVMDNALALQRLRLRRYLSTLATIGSTAPFIGLFGTVLGVMAAFQEMARSQLTGEKMSAGISEALSATALGLLVAIPSVMAYNFLIGRVQAMLLHIQGHVVQLTPMLQTPAREKQEV